MPCVVCWRSRAHNGASSFLARGLAAAIVRGDSYGHAYDAGVSNILAQLEPRPSQPAGVLIQRFELIDPNDPSVVQPADVAAGAAPPSELHRVRAGCPGTGRVAAGVPKLYAHPTQQPPPLAPRKGAWGGPRLRRGAPDARARTLLWCAMAALTAAAALGWRAATPPPPPLPLISVDAAGVLHL